MIFKIEDVERFWKNVNVKLAGDCWEWLNCTTSGYGVCQFDGKQRFVHVLSYCLNNSIPYEQIKENKLSIKHTCGNKLCCNPSHIIALTDSDRFWDKVDIKGPDDCWNWTGNLYNKTYGVFGHDGISTKTNEYAYEDSYGRIDVDSYVYGFKLIHSCGNNRCCNPSHIKCISTEELFWSNVLVLSDNDCWEWQGKKNEYGYGVFPFKNKNTGAHRVSLILKYGELEYVEGKEKLVAMHTICDNPGCVNPYHLKWGTSSENILEMHEKGRAATAESGNMSTLTRDQVLYIRENKSVSSTKMAIEIGVSQCTISRIRNGKRWGHIPIE